MLVASAFVSSPLLAAGANTPAILDTDVGTDIDDAFALALIINSPELELPGVTTVAGDTQARAAGGQSALASERRPAQSPGL
jgi:hypothetical protein